MTRRFYVSAGLNQATISVAGPEAHHMAHVLRCRVGDQVELFDGRGTVALAEIETVGRHAVTLRLLHRHRFEQDETSSVILATAVPKGDRFRWLVEKATELGVRRLVPLRTQRSVVVPSAGKLQKMSQTVIEACKQSGRNWLMEITPLVSWDTVVAEATAAGRLIVAHPDGQPTDAALIDSLKRAGKAPVWAAIGPEGGFTDEEIDQARQAGAVLIGLGKGTLRVETAAIALCAWLRLSIGAGSGCQSPPVGKSASLSPD
ncbi:MAG: 16S rRNA (uracil(1498)-N(3))-methyltransferase [Planctomycetes bacterium]|nr:16S rRNA (uracil(1498)-N(3))-methyltransferase [Planctomycetota bacterium]